MKRRIIFIVASILLIQASEIIGQDFSFSQFEFAPQFLNPSYSGVSQGFYHLMKISGDQF